MVKAKEPPVGFSFDLAKRNAYLEVRRVSTVRRGRLTASGLRSILATACYSFRRQKV